MMRWLILGLVGALLTACGIGNIIDPGTYKVTQSLKGNTCPFELSSTHTRTYDVTVSGDSYRITVSDDDDVPYVMTGEAEGSEVVATFHESIRIDGCVFNINIRERIRAEGNGFKGSGTESLTACDGSSCQITYSFTGKPR